MPVLYSKNDTFAPTRGRSPLADITCAHLLWALRPGVVNSHANKLKIGAKMIPKEVDLLRQQLTRRQSTFEMPFS